MEMAQQVRTPLLALFVHFCSWIGYPTEETGLQQWDSSFVLTAKIAAHGIAFYGLFTLDAYNIETISHDPNYRKHKSLFGLVVDCLLRHLFPVTFVMNSIFYFRNGPQLVRLLDSECFYRFYQFSPFKRVFGCIITITVMVYTITYHTILFELARYRFSLVKMLYIFAIFLLDSQFQLLWGVIFYCKYATLRTLEGLHQKMLHNQPNIERKIIWNVQRLAYANYKLNQLTSPLMLFFVISHVIDFLATLFLMIKFNLFWENLGTLTIMLVMISTVIHFSLSIRGQLRQIQSLIVERHHLCAGFTRRSTEFSAYSRGLWIRVYQLEIYFEYFPLKLFNLCTIDLCLLLQTAVLVFNCFLVTIQTDESSFRQSLAKLLGFRTEETQWNHWQSVLQLVWIALLNSVAMYTLIMMDVLDIFGIIQNSRIMEKRSYFGFIIDSAMRYLLPILFPFKFAFYTYYGPSIVHLLDSPCISHFYRNYGRWRGFVLVLVFCLIYNLLLFDTIRGKNWIHYIMQHWALYLFDIQDYLWFAILWYVKYATCLNLYEICESIRSSHTLFNFKRLKTQLQLLACVNCKLNQKTSGLLLVYFIMRSIDVLNLIYLSMMLNFLQSISLLGLNVLIVFCLTRIQLDIDRLLQKLHVSLVGLKSFSVGGDNIGKYELQIYHQDFDLQIYQLCRIDMAFGLAACIFTCHYFLLTIQTTDLR